MNNKELFIIWLDTVKNQNGKLYESGTKKDYINALEKFCAKMKGIKIEHLNIFDYSTLDEFRSAVKVIKKHKDFKLLNENTHNKLPAAINMYEKFLEIKENAGKFKMPTKSNLSARTSTINNAFTIAVTPFIKPDNNYWIWYYNELDIMPGKCAYCLQSGNSADHIFPLVKDTNPSGYITDIHNLIPCCPACNSSKGSKDFMDWYLNEKNVERLKKIGLSDKQINYRYKVISSFIDNHTSEPLNYKEIVGEELWNEYLRRKENLINTLKDNQNFCEKIQKIIENSVIDDNNS